MKITSKNNKRILVYKDKKNKKKVDISDGNIIQYTGIYYKSKTNNSDIYTLNESKTKFIGKIITNRGDSIGITGIYIEPLYMLDKNICEWVKINNYEPPKNKYFFYPHLLMLPDKYYHHKPLYFLHTCEQSDLSDFFYVNKTIDLDYINY